MDHRGSIVRRIVIDDDDLVWDFATLVEQCFEGSGQTFGSIIRTEHHGYVDIARRIFDAHCSLAWSSATGATRRPDRVLDERRLRRASTKKPKNSTSNNSSISNA